MTIRHALPQDAEDICQVHHRSVEALAASHYTPRRIELWTRGMTPQVITERLPREQAQCLVAQCGEAVQGFGIILGNEIRAVYVDPQAARQGLGRGLLQGLENIGKAQGQNTFLLNASLNAQGFYEAMGYTVTRQSEFALNEDEAMACLVMEKHT